MKRFVIVMTLVGLVVGALATPVLGADDRLGGHEPMSARIFISADVSLPAPYVGDFNARGAAAARGYVCPAGTIEGELTGDGGPDYDFTVTHTFICADGSGTFAIDLWVRLFDTGTTFDWEVSNGTGDYVGLHGSGWGKGRPNALDPNVIRDRYWGKVGF